MPRELITDMDKEITLGDIHKALQKLIKKGAHPGSIDWVLHTKIEWPEGHVEGNH